MNIWAQKERDLSVLPLLFCSSPTSVNERMVSTHTGEGDLFVSLLNQMLTASRNNLRDTPRNNALPAIWPCIWLVKLIRKINYHKPYFCFSLFLHPLAPIQNVCSSNKYTVLLPLFRSLNTPFLLPAIPSHVSKHTSLRRGCKINFH